MRQHIQCPNCQYIGRAQTITPGSFATEIVLWLFGGVGLFYSAWRLAARYQGCPRCQWKYIIPR